MTVVSPSKTATSPQQVHEGHTNEAIHIQDQVGFLKNAKQMSINERECYLNVCFID